MVQFRSGNSSGVFNKSRLRVKLLSRIDNHYKISARGEKRGSGKVGPICFLDLSENTEL